MADEIKIAWRNLWRNRRRTLITSASVFFAVFFALIMRSYQLGSYDHMITSFIESFTGYLQVQHVKYQDSPIIDHSFEFSDSLVNEVLKLENVVSVTPHIESFSLASSGPQTKGVAVIAIDTRSEKQFSDPENKLVKFRITRQAIDSLKAKKIIPQALMERMEQNLDRSYSSLARFELELGFSDEEKELYLPVAEQAFLFKNGYLTGQDEGILVSDRLSLFLKVSVGDSVILMGQGYHGVSATGIFPVRGIIKMPSPDIDNRMVIMTLPAARRFFDTNNRITSLALNLTDRSERTLKAVREKVNALLPGQNTTTKTWYELNPILYQQIQGDNQSGVLMLFILYFIIFFGIFGTVMMMVSERKREFGVLVAIGMQKSRLKRVIQLEMFMLGVMGLLAGLLASAPFIVYFYFSPIVLKGEMGKMMEDYGWDAVMPTAWFGPYVYWQIVVVAVMIGGATLYALRKINTLKVIEALKS